MGRGLGAGPRGGACGLGGRLRELSGAPNGCARAAVGAGGHGGRRGAAERRERDESDRARAAGAPARPGPTRPPARDAPRGRPPAQLTRGPRTPARARPRRRLRRRDGGEGRGLAGHRAAAGHGQRGLAVRRRKCGPARASPACAAAAGRPRSTLAGPDTPRARAPGRRPARARPPEPPEPRLAPRPGPFPGSSSPPRTPEARTPGAGPARRLICAGPRAPSAPRRRGCRQPAPNSAGPDLPPAPRSSHPTPSHPGRALADSRRGPGPPAQSACSGACRCAAGRSAQLSSALRPLATWRLRSSNLGRLWALGRTWRVLFRNDEVPFRAALQGQGARQGARASPPLLAWLSLSPSLQPGEPTPTPTRGAPQAPRLT